MRPKAALRIPDNGTALKALADGLELTPRVAVRAERLPIGHRKIMRYERDGKSGAAKAIWGRLVSYDGYKPIYKEET